MQFHHNSFIYLGSYLNVSTHKKTPKKVRVKSMYLPDLEKVLECDNYGYVIASRAISEYLVQN